LPTNQKNPPPVFPFFAGNPRQSRLRSWQHFLTGSSERTIEGGLMFGTPRYFLVSVIFLSAGPAFAQPGADKKAPTNPLIVKIEPASLPEHARQRLGKIGGYRYAAPVSGGCISPDGKRLAVASAGGNVGIAIIDLATNQTVQRLQTQVFGGQQEGMAFSADGSTFAVQNFQDLRVWDIASGKQIRQFQQRDNGGRNHAPSLSRDGKIVGVGSERFNKNMQFGEVKAFETATGKAIGPFETVHNYNIRVAVAPDGKTMASWGGYLQRAPGMAADRDLHRTIQIWDLAAGKEQKQIKLDSGPFGGMVHAGAFSPDGKTLAIGSGASTFHLIDVATGKETRRFAGQRTLGGANMHFSPDGKILAVFESYGGTLQAWNIASGKRLELVDAPKMQILAIGFPGNERVIAVGMLAQSLCWWDATDPKASDFQGHLAPIVALTFTPDGKSILSAGGDQRLLWWDAAAGAPQRQLHLADEDDDRYGGRHGFTSFALAADGRHAVTYSFSGNTLLRMWNLKTGRAVCDFEGPRSYSQIGLAFSPDGSKLATAGARSPMLIWDVHTGQEIPTMPADKVVANPNNDIQSRIAFSHDGKIIAIQKTDRFNNRGVADFILWDLVQKRDLCRAPMPMGNFGMASGGSMAFSCDDRYLAVSNPGGVIALLSARDGKEMRRFTSTLRNSSFQLAFSSDGRFLAAGAASNFFGGFNNGPIDEPIIEIWELASGQRREQFKGHIGAVTCLAFSPDGATLASGSMDTTALLWDMTGKSGPKMPSIAAAELPAVWKSFAGTDEKIAASIRRLVQTPETTVPFFKQHFQPAKGESIDEKVLDKLVADLDSANFKTRDKATKELLRIAVRAESALVKGLKTHTSLEVRRRIQDILETIVRHEPTPEELQAMRGVEVLERIGNAEARQWLTELAKGDPVARATQEAKGALKRMAGK
jgi:WD40 repeat protein